MAFERSQEELEAIEQLNQENRKRVRQPDGDLMSYLNNNTELYSLERIKNIIAEVPGQNDDAHWYWIIELKTALPEGRFVLTDAWCDYTGWDCQSGGESKAAPTARKAALLAPEKDYYGRKIRQALLDQITGKQPFGTYSDLT